MNIVILAVAVASFFYAQLQTMKYQEVHQRLDDFVEREENLEEGYKELHERSQKNLEKCEQQKDH